MLYTLIKGMMVSLSLIVAIGSQNMYVLKQGLLKKNIFYVSLICFLIDAVLMSFGIYGVGTIIQDSKTFTVVLSLLGALFLFGYGILSFANAYKGTSFINMDDKKVQKGLKQTILVTLAVSLLNPHVYLDTVVVVGGVAAQLSSNERIYFLVGALISSFIWFFGLGYGARILIPLFGKKTTWRILDLAIGFIMITISYSLFSFVMQ
jgi:L-lysine exporter family protein LysE/ArgO